MRASLRAVGPRVFTFMPSLTGSVQAVTAVPLGPEYVLSRVEWCRGKLRQLESERESLRGKLEGLFAILEQDQNYKSTEPSGVYRSQRKAPKAQHCTAFSLPRG